MNKKLEITIKINMLFLSIILVTLFLPKKVFAGLNTDYVELQVTYKKSDGETCTADSDCSSGNCVDGYCCDTACDGTCEACDISGSEGTCTYIAEDTDPDGECDSTCVDACEDRTGDCDGAGACKTTYCSAGTACSAGACDGANYCNETLAYCSCQGDGCYNDGGTNYECQGQCDGSGTCDYASNCSSITLEDVEGSLKFSGDFKMKNVNMSFKIAPTPTPGPCGGVSSVSYGGDTYSTVEIGDQCWFAENLNLGTMITGGPDQGTSCSDVNKYCYNNESAKCDTYGGLYQWEQAMCGSSSCNGTGSSQPECSSPVQGICPDGWHLPSHYEITALEREICSDIGNTNCDTEFPYDESTTSWRGQDTTDAHGEGSAMAGGCDLWTDDDLNNSGSCDNDFGTSGLDMLPGGLWIGVASDYGSLGDIAYLWSSTEHYSSDAWSRYLYYDHTDVDRYVYGKDYGFSVRCVKD